MTVSELIERLKMYPDNMPVAIGSNELLVVHPQKVQLVGEDKVRDVLQLDWFPF